MITDPRLILLDEPTSGLDSFTTVKIVKVLQKLARKRNKTIVSTIHQPSSEAYSYCDRLILLADGHVVYQGPGSEVVDHFKLKDKGAKNCNPCDWFMRELSVNYPKSVEDQQKIDHYVKRYQDDMEKKVLADLDGIRFEELNLELANRRHTTYCE